VLALGAAAVLTLSTQGGDAGRAGTPGAGADHPLRREDLVVTEERFGPRDYQVALVYRPRGDVRRNKTIYLFHGGGWTKGDAEGSRYQALYFARRGWTIVNAQYRLGDDGEFVLNDLAKLLRRYEGDPRVDPGRQIASGGSAGGHVALMMAGSVAKGHFQGAIVWSPVVSPRLAYLDGRATDSNAAQRILGREAARVWGDDHWSDGAAGRRLAADLPPVWVAGSADEFVVWQHQGGLLCRLMGPDRCTSTVVEGDRHVPVTPELAADAERWATRQVN
jgi:acetyl esterase/lipase